jgi:hypothetical protein
VLAHVATPVLNAIRIRVAFKITQLSKFLKKNPWDLVKFREKTQKPGKPSAAKARRNSNR